MEVNQLIVCKFGGTSVQDAASIRNCIEILIENPSEESLWFRLPQVRLIYYLKLAWLLNKGIAINA